MCSKNFGGLGNVRDTGDVSLTQLGYCYFLLQKLLFRCTSIKRDYRGLNASTTNL